MLYYVTRRKIVKQIFLFYDFTYKNNFICSSLPRQCYADIYLIFWNELILWFRIDCFDSSVDVTHLYLCHHKCLPPPGGAGDAGTCWSRSRIECVRLDGPYEAKPPQVRPVTPVPTPLCAHLCQYAHAHTRFHLRACECSASLTFPPTLSLTHSLARLPAGVSSSLVPPQKATRDPVADSAFLLFKSI